ncbi:16S rRNA (adenine(1518)-N(6)/adenine(1519)-N(6))-dimethyltransferase RsmA [Treponema sp.]|uniref:16S rRNA (adenine(1518)-N(6)/adenine(1519)-N(6))- dimethyltransferase RsmA n=1 Tax=Treponema sp. TaxID=166 RepID=UPI00298D8FC4|nr:16S rRNA (adenine(1518)-N(6)/adenine(1519)-N(6))-dimethyltransferase RsmA [Treponema sp.]MCQ2240634.1 16S rRNA (adenine(1518)-N(6)/adenine(1519)-N(6))-dimethyltransferase RsmA [Treponema sp.]
MKHPDYNSPAELKSFLDSQGFAMQKKFGQNFMINGDARKKIIDVLDPKEGEVIWEVGPGLGCMTEEIMNRGAVLNAFEIDKGFIGLLHQFFEEQEAKGQFGITEGDVLKTWKKHFENCSQKPSKLFGNLPYNIAATFIADTIVEGLVFDRCVFTVQKEVTERVAAAPGTENYSAFSVLCQWGYNVKKGIVLSSANFWPRPNVASQAFSLEKKETPVQCKDNRLFVKVVHALFASRRKTLLNNIKPLLTAGMNAEEIFDRAGISKMERAENLTVEQFAKITDVLSDCLCSAKIES